MDDWPDDLPKAKAEPLRAEDEVPMKTPEPARLIALATAAITSLIGLLVAFGVDLTQEQQAAILATFGTVTSLIVVAGEMIRSRVTPTRKAEQIIDIAYRANPDTDPRPRL